MTMPVWFVCDVDGETGMFIAAPTRNAARSFGWQRDFDLSGYDYTDIRARKVCADGTLGGRGPQAVVESERVRELTDEECAALHWSVHNDQWVHGDWCESCEYVVEEPEDACVDCPLRVALAQGAVR
jgi:hypothetical protein